jgi:TatD DNase family protein
MPPATSPLYISRVNKAEKWQEGQGVKGRMEPADVTLIAEVVAKVKGVDLDQLLEAAWENSEKLFWTV